MCRKDERTHKHHIIPKYMGGTNEPENLVEVTVTQHAMFHFCNYQLWGNDEDRIAWRGLSGLITPDETALEAQVLGAKKSGKITGNKHKENKTGIFGLSPEQLSQNGKKAGKIGGNKTKENKTGIFGLSLEEMMENRKKGGNKTKENKTGIFGLSPEQLSQNGKKGGKIAGNKHKENKTGFCGMTSEEKGEAGKKANFQKWQCTKTGYISTACGLTHYQNKRGIDTSNRIKVDDTRSWEITFEDGKVIVTYQTLKDWAEENGYSYNCLRKIRIGKTKNYRGIIKITCL